jgi:hypothetical protein
MQPFNKAILALLNLSSLAAGFRLSSSQDETLNTYPM